MLYPHELEDGIHENLALGDLEGAKAAQRQFVEALRSSRGEEPTVLRQLLHSCTTQMKIQLAAIFGDRPELPSRLEIAERLSASETPAQIIDSFERTTASMISRVRLEDNVVNSVAWKAKVYVDDNFSREITTRSVATAVACSEAYLCTSFKGEYGLTVGEYIRKRRIDSARAMLLATRLPVSTIGYRIGFQTYRTFLRAFRAEAGMSPQQYRGREIGRVLPGAS